MTNKTYTESASEHYQVGQRKWLKENYMSKARKCKLMKPNGQLLLTLSVQICEPEQTTAHSSNDIILVLAGEPEETTAFRPNSIAPDINPDFDVRQL